MFRNHTTLFSSICEFVSIDRHRTMGSEDSSDILHDFFPLMRVYKYGRVERFSGEDVVPAGVDAETGVKFKDVEISPEPKVSARLYLPKAAGQGRKLPLLVYFHGGGFIVESAFSPTYMKHLCLVAAEANAVIVSVDYRLAPEHPLPAAFDDSWLALKWVAAAGGGGEEWLKEYVDFDRVFLGGDSAGGTIAHNMAVRVGVEGLDGVKLDGVFLNCPFFWGKDPIAGEGDDEGVSSFIENLWRFVSPKTSGLDDPDLNPEKNPEYAAKLGCNRVLVYVAEQDPLRHRGRRYTEELAKQGWRGEAEVVEAKGEIHVFNLFTPTSDNAMAMVKKLVTFFNHCQS